MSFTRPGVRHNAVLWDEGGMQIRCAVCPGVQMMPIQGEPIEPHVAPAGASLMEHLRKHVLKGDTFAMEFSVVRVQVREIS